MKRMMVALLAGAAVFAVAFGAAATLGVEGGTIQAGVDSSLYCDNDGVQVEGWGLETDTGMVSFVRLGGIDADCENNDIFVRISDAGGGLFPGTFSATIAPSGGSVMVPFSPLDASRIEDIHVWIEGPNGD
jgi:hypothetical protein